MQYIRNRDTFLNLGAILVCEVLPKDQHQGAFGIQITFATGVRRKFFGARGYAIWTVFLNTTSGSVVNATEDSFNGKEGD